MWCSVTGVPAKTREVRGTIMRGERGVNGFKKAGCAEPSPLPRSAQPSPTLSLQTRMLELAEGVEPPTL